MAPGGRHIEVLGSWDPHQKKGVFQGEKIKEWMGKGAQVSDTVWNLLIRQGIIEGKKRSVKIHPVKSGEAGPQNAEFNGVKKPAEVKAEENKTEVAAEKAETKETANEPEKPEVAKPEEKKAEKTEEKLQEEQKKE